MCFSWDVSEALPLYSPSDRPPSLLYPQSHNEEIPLLENGTYKIQGYAYCGGGRRVHRVEVSLDDGQVGQEEGGREGEGESLAPLRKF